MVADPIARPTLLLVEDDIGLQMVLEMALSDEGVDVVLASNGHQAIAELESDQTRFRAVVTDIRLGEGPSGWEVGHRAREAVPGIPVIYMSGDSAREWCVNGVPESIMLQKPFVLTQLVTTLATLLNHASSNIAAQGTSRQDEQQSIARHS